MKDWKKTIIKESFTIQETALNLSESNLKISLVLDKGGRLIGTVTDGDIRRFTQRNQNLHSISVKEIMTKNPIGIDRLELAAKGLSLMNNKRITSLCVYDKKNKFKTIGVLSIHNILQSNIS